MRQIPLRLLPHECLLKHRTGTDRNRNPVYSETVLKHVRVGATLQTVRGTIGETKADTLTLFVDAVNTRYETAEGNETAAVLPVELDAVEWQGRLYTVRSVMPCCTTGAAPHHWEVALE